MATNKKYFLSNIDDIVQDIPSIKDKFTEEIEPSIVYRKWGYYQILSEDKKFKIKKITIFPGQSISLQVHQKRNEHWNFIEGEGEVISGVTLKKITKNDQIFIPKKTKHKVVNISSKELLIFIEVQTGGYYGEDDIERF